MNQMQALLEKARNDKALMAKLNELGAGGAAPGKIVALAAEYGFTLTPEDCQSATGQMGARKTGELKEEDLEAAAGGIFGQTENRYDPKICDNTIKVLYECVGFLGHFWCDHYKEGKTGSGRPYVKCNMGKYDYEPVV